MSELFDLSFLDNTFLGIKFLNNTLKSYLMFVLLIAAGMLLLLLIKKLVIRRLRARAKKTKTDIDNVLVNAADKYLLPVLRLGVLYIGTKILNLHETVAQVINIAVIAFVIFFGARLVSAVAVYLFGRSWEKKKGKSDPMTVKWFAVIIKAVIWGAAALLFLENIGVEITALIAGLGIGGLAVAFAAQTVLEDIFSFVTILFDKPFEIGDYIVVDELMGNVEHIGIKTTRIRSLSGEQLIFSNKDLTGSRVKNFKRMLRRRAVFQIKVAYETSLPCLKEIPVIIERIIKKVEYTEFDRAHFSSFSDSGLVFDVVFYVLSQDYNIYMNARQEINFCIKEEFDRRKIQFAFPAQTIYAQTAKPQKAGEEK
ncbi:MAG: mechanosensitive ion channel family protein [Christensenellales bacterium]